MISKSQKFRHKSQNLQTKEVTFLYKMTSRSKIPGCIKILIWYQLTLLTKILWLDIPPSDIDQINCMNKKNKANMKGPRKTVSVNKRKFKGTNITVTESFTFLQMAKFWKMRDEYRFNKVWFSDGKKRRFYLT